eukprot:12424434-Karenia_brevis.AAC.1
MEEGIHDVDDLTPSKIKITCTGPKTKPRGDTPEGKGGPKPQGYFVGVCSPRSHEPYAAP